MPTPPLAPEELARRLEAYSRLGDVAAAARELNLDRGTLRSTLRKAAAEKRGASILPTMEVSEVTDQYDAEGNLKAFSVRQRPESTGSNVTQETPLPGFAFKRISSNFRGDGTIGQEWRIQSPEIAKQWREIESVLDSRIERIPPRPPTSDLVPHSAPDLMNHLTIADGHVGAMAWGVETGTDNWDLNLAHTTILAGSMWIIDNLPDADEILINILGDFTDTDGYVPATPASKHILDVDGRFPRIVDVAEDVIEQIVLHALTKHHKVRLVIMPGNHDPLTAMWMRKLFTRIFRDEPRVVVDPSIRNIWCMKFGLNMIAAHHGDKIAMPQLPSVFANDFAPMWGETVFRYCSTGHLHHKHMVKHVGKQHTGMMVYQHPTISARNAWAAERGYPEARELLGHSYHIRCGMRTTLHFTPEMLTL